MFYDRFEAGRILAKQLKKYKDEPGVVLAVPRGGVPIAHVVAKEMGWPVDLLLVKKIGHPLNREYAIGSVSLTERYIVPHKGVSYAYIDAETEKIRQRLRELYRKLMGNKQPQNLKNKIVIVIDDGIATGNTLMGAINILRQSAPRKIIVAVPVASPEALKKIAGFVDEIVCPLVPEYFTGVGTFYENFEQVSDEEAVALLNTDSTSKKI